MRTPDSSLRPALSFRLALGLLIGLTVVRIAGLQVSSVDFFYDEAQYWAWSRDFALGYATKPPLLAWIIAFTDSVCGSGEACIRAASPVFYLATSVVIYFIAEELYGEEAGFWTALTFALLLGASFSARIISTDVPLLFCWAVALLAFIKLLRGPDWRWTIVLGVALGLGLLAKYAMAYFVLGVALAALLDRDVRVLLRRWQPWAALAVALLILSPNVYWNLANQFATLQHTGDNITGGGLRLQPLAVVEFIGAQFVVASPFVFAAFLVILFRSATQRVGREDRLMLAFAIPPLALVIGLSLFRNTHANWAAASLISVTILVVAWWLRNGGKRWLVASLALGLFAQAAMIAGDAFADRIHLPGLGRKADIYQRTLGWRDLAEKAARLARTEGARTVAAERRAEAASLTYYLRNTPLKVVSWPVRGSELSHFDIEQPLDNTSPEPILLVTNCPHDARLRRFFATVTELAPISAVTGPTSARSYRAFKLAGRQRPIGPLGPCRRDAR